MDPTSYPYPSDKFWKKVSKDPVSGCWLWTGRLNMFNYGELSYRLEGKSKHIKAHRLSWILHNGPIPTGLCVLHTCDVRNCVNPSHLWLGTNNENMADMARKGRSCSGTKNGSYLHPESRPRGENHYAAKHTIAQVKEVKALLASGVRHCDITRLTGIHGRIIGCIKKGRSWKHVT